MGGSDGGHGVVLDLASDFSGAVGAGEAGDEVEGHVDARADAGAGDDVAVVDEAGPDVGDDRGGSTFVLIALYFQQVLAMPPQEAGIAMVPTSLTGLAVSLGVLPRALRTFGPLRTLVLGLVLLAGGQLWLAYPPQGFGYVLEVLPGLLLVATGVALSFTPTTMVVASAAPTTHTGLAAGLASASMQVGGALGTAAFIVIGASAGHQATGAIDGSGFTAAFTAGAVVALATAVLGWRTQDAGRPGARRGKGVL